MLKTLLRRGGGLGLLVVLLGCVFPTPARADDAQPRLDAAAVRAGFQIYRDHAWGMVRARVSNPTSEVSQPLVSVRLEPRDSIEFAYRLWMPPRSRREALIPVFPFEVHPEANSIDAPTRLIDDTGRRARATPWHPALLPLRRERLSTTHIGDWDDRDDRRGVVRALREHMGLHDGVLLTQGRDVPRQPIAWEAVDVIVISSHRPELNAIQRDALRRWLVRGGRLWIMLDRVDPTWLADTLGESWDVAVSDYVGLHEFDLEDAAGEVRHSVRSEFGVEMARAFASKRMEVVHRVRGYPASMRRDVGRGKLLVTTVGPEAWVRADEKALPALEDLGAFFERPSVSSQQRRAVVTEAFEPFVHDQIGYKIIGRGWVAAVLGGFVATLLGAGLVLTWRGRMELTGVSSVVAALAAAGSLIGLGMAHHSSQPLTVTTGQVVYANPEQPYIHTIGATGIYVPTAHGDARMTITGRHGVSWPADADVMGTFTRLEWTDHDTWRLAGRSLPPGTVHRFPGEGTQAVDAPTRAVLRFGVDGLSGTLTSSAFAQLEDAVIATRRGRLAVSFDSGSTEFEARLGPLEPRQFIDRLALTERQNRRQRVYRALAEGGVSAEEPTLPGGILSRRPALMGWIEGGTVEPLRLNAGERRESHSLVIVPLEIEPPTPGELITIPSVLMDKRVPGLELDQVYRPGGIYESQAREWIAPIGRSAAAVMRFEPPPGIGHLDVHAATLRFHLRAPGWRYQVLVWREGRIEVAHEGIHPLGEVEVRLEADQAPQMTEDGALLAGLRIERDEAGGGGGQWSLSRLDLSITGARPEPSTRTTPGAQDALQ